MLIVMNPDATAADIRRVVETIESLGFKAHPMPGSNRTAIGLTGNQVAIDPAPFNDRDLDPSAEAFIVNWSKDLPREAPLALLVHLDRPCDLAEAAAVLREAVHRFFAERARSERRRLRELLKRGRISLVIGLAFVAVTVGATTLAQAWWPVTGYGRILDESLLIVGWVAMWRPLEIFLYDWWPIRAEARLFERLAAMPVRVTSSARLSTSG